MPILSESRPLSTRLLGDHYPFVWKHAGHVHYANTAAGLIEEHKGPRRFDPATLLSLFSFEYVCLDRTMLQDVLRLPWLSEISSDGSTEYFDAPPHGSERRTARTLAELFVGAMERELLGFTKGHQVLYLLLSGGMDSRIVAAILQKLQREGRLNIEIRAVVWGPTDSRDVVYSERIAKGYGWSWTRLPLTSSTYWDNFEWGANVLAAEVDPKHLHRLDWFSNVEPDALVLAASYGDSVGRAEFGSRRVAQLPEMVPRDRYAFLREPHLKKATQALQRDLRSLATRHGARSSLGWVELGRQANYMRRHLCVVTNVVGEWATFRQAMVSPEVFGLMWETHMSDRTDMMYVECLRLVDPRLLDIPWARTGLPYDGQPGVQDALKRGYHQYGKWLRTDHHEQIASLLFDGTLSRLEAIDTQQVRWMFNEWRRERIGDDTSLATQLSALAGLSAFASRAGLQAPGDSSRDVPFLRTAVARASQKARRTTRPARMLLRKRR